MNKLIKPQLNTEWQPAWSPCRVSVAPEGPRGLCCSCPGGLGPSAGALDGQVTVVPAAPQASSWIYLINAPAFFSH